MIKNVTKGTLLARRNGLCNNFLASKKQAFTLFFVKHCLDVLFLNNNCEVVDLAKGLEPGSFYSPKKKGNV